MIYTPFLAIVFITSILRDGVSTEDSVAVIHSNASNIADGSNVLYQNYNSLCMTCNPSAAGANCQIKEGMCYIGNVCYKEKDMPAVFTYHTNELHSYPVCCPNLSQTAWVYKDESGNCNAEVGGNVHLPVIHNDASNVGDGSNVLYQKYNSLCMSCNPSSRGQECQIKEGMCYIENACYKELDSPVVFTYHTDELNSIPLCCPSQSQTGWIYHSGKNCAGQAENTQHVPQSYTIYWVTGAAVLLLIVIVGVVFYKRRTQGTQATEQYRKLHTDDLINV